MLVLLLGRILNCGNQEYFTDQEKHADEAKDLSSVHCSNSLVAWPIYYLRLVDDEYNGQISEKDDEDDENYDASFVEAVAERDHTVFTVSGVQVDGANDAEDHSNREAEAVNVAVASQTRDWASRGRGV